MSVFNTFEEYMKIGAGKEKRARNNLRHSRIRDKSLDLLYKDSEDNNHVVTRSNKTKSTIYSHLSS